MKPSDLKQAIKPYFTFVFACFLCIFVHSFWIQVVDPFPENDSVFSFYYPILNYLKASSLIENDFFFLTQFTHRGDYPLGSALLASILSYFSLNHFVLENPYLLSFIVLGCASIVPLFFKNKNKVIFLLLILSNPFVVLCIRSLSPHGFIIFFSLLSFLFFKSYLAHKHKNINLIAFCITSVASISLKHLGLIYFLNLVLAYLFYAVLNHKKDHKVWLAFMLSLVLGMSFYPLDGLKDYLIHVIAYKNYTSLKPMMVMVFALCCLKPITYFIRFNKIKKPKVFNIFGWGSAYVTFATLSLFFLINQVYLGLHGSIYFLFTSFLLLWVFYFSLNKNSLKDFIFLFTIISFVCASGLFLSDLGRSFYVFFLPVLILFIQFISNCKNSYFLLLIFIIQVLVSNFFPSSHYFKEKHGQAREMIPTQIFNATHINFFSWSKCPVPKIRKTINTKLNNLQLTGQSYLMIQENLHFYTKAILYLPLSLIDSGPSFHRPDNLPQETLQTLLTQVKQNKIKTYKKFSAESKFPLIMLGVSPFVTLSKINDPKLDNIIKEPEPSLNEFAQSLARDYFQFLKQSGELESKYIAFNIPKNNPIIKLYLDKKYHIPQNKMKQNYATSELYREYKKYKKLNQL